VDADDIVRQRQIILVAREERADALG